VKVDAGQMEQVLMNLAVNARDAMPRGGQLRIRTCPHVLPEPCHVRGVAIEAGRYLLVTVKDTGTGMGPEVARQVFEPFFTTKVAGQGTGLGLSTVYGIVKQSGGYILLDSEPGRGTAFEIYLPNVDEPLDTIRADTGPPRRADGSETVLLVDDDTGIRELMRRTLKDGGYQVMTAPDGLEALAVARAHAGSIHILITDVVMPRMGGIELAAQITAIRGDMTVLYISGYTDRREWMGAASQVRSAYLQKPFTPSVLMRKVRELLDAPASADARRAPTPREAE